MVIFIGLILKHNGFRTGRGVTKILVVKYEALYNLSLGISDMTNHCLFTYLSSGGDKMGRRKEVLGGATWHYLRSNEKAGRRR